MKSLFSVAILLASIVFSSVCFADNEQDPHPFRFGFGADVGVPSGLSVGFVLHPKVDWLTTQLSLSDNVLSPGARLSVKLDPLQLTHTPVSLLFDGQAGFMARGGVPGHTDLPHVGYDYVNLYGALRLGNANGFHWLIEAGPSFLHANTSNFQSVVKNNSSGLTIGNPTVNGWFVPTFVTGMETVF